MPRARRHLAQLPGMYPYVQSLAVPSYLSNLVNLSEWSHAYAWYQIFVTFPAPSQKSPVAPYFVISPMPL